MMIIKTMLLSVSLFITILVSPYLSSTMPNTETQPYRVIKIEKDFEIRLYPSATMATVSMTAKNYKELSSPGFKKLAGYIFGGNTSNQNIAMTTPVHMDIQEAGSSMSFVMPAVYNKDNLPKPNDSAVIISTTAEEYVAAIRFGGYADDEDIKKNASKLEAALKTKKIGYYGNFRFLGYNAPYQFWGRKNEIIVSVRWNEK